MLNDQPPTFVGDPSILKQPGKVKTAYNKKGREFISAFWVEYGARTHDLLNHNQAL